MAKTRHSSLEMPDPEVVVKEKKKDMLSKARNKLYNLSDALKSKNINNNEEQDFQPTGGAVVGSTKRSRALSYFLKPCPNKPEKNTNRVIENGGDGKTGSMNEIIGNTATALAGRLQRGFSLRKQHSVGAYPIQRDDPVDMDEAIRYDIATRHSSVSNNNCTPNYIPISRLRPATICGDKVNRELSTDALALERPRKKLSFREPEITESVTLKHTQRKAMTPEMKRSISLITNPNNNYINFKDYTESNGGVRRVPSLDLEDLDLEVNFFFWGGNCFEVNFVFV